jgi:hypothetical protein
VLERVPEYIELSEQLELSAQKLTRLGLFEFLFRPATREGEVSQSVLPISIADYLRDTKNGEFQFPDQAWANRYRASLAARVGIPIAKTLEEQEQRLLHGTPHEQQEPLQQVTTVTPVAAPDGMGSNGHHPSTEQQPVREENGTHPEPLTGRETQSHPTLDEDQWEFLTYLINNPDLPVNVVYKEVGIKAAKITQIRDELEVQGLLVDLDIRTGRIGAGRPTKFLLPTFHAFELLGKDPPAGRGGMVHRALQHMVMEGAIAKGYSARTEYALGNGAIVDVHLEKGGEKIAVEIAVISKPRRELAHIRQCLLAGYDKVCTVFADPRLLEKTNESLAGEFSDEKRAKVQLIPLSKLSGISSDTTGIG